MGITVLNKEAFVYDSTVEFSTIICCNCGVPFAMPSRLKTHYLASQENFYCPNGHPQAYVKSTETRLREQLEEQRRTAEANAQFLKDEAQAWQNQWQTQLRAKQKAERTLRRVHNGVCTCCNRSFANLAAHMKTKHPEIGNKLKTKKQKP